MINIGDIYRRNNYENSGYGNYIIIVTHVLENYIHTRAVYDNPGHVYDDHWTLDCFLDRFIRIEYD